GALALPAVALLQLAGQVLAVARRDIEDVVAQVAPLGLRLTLELGPLAGNDVLVHCLILLELEGGIDAVFRVDGSSMPASRSRSDQGSVNPCSQQRTEQPDEKVLLLPCCMQRAS